MMAKSLYTRVLLICLGTALLSLAASLVVFTTVGRERYQQNFRQFGRVELDLAIFLYRHGGPDALATYVARLDRDFDSTHFFVNAHGTDLVTGEDRSSLWPLVDNPNARKWAAVSAMKRFLEGSTAVSVTRSDDGTFAMIAESSPWITARAQLPYYLAILVGACLLQGLAAVRVVRSLRAIGDATARFGTGDLEARVTIPSRRDEVGTLARAFNGMADHVRELLLAQRRLIQDISHEFRSPLARLAFATELSRTADDRDAAADEIRRQVDCLAKLVSELVQLVRVEGDHRYQFVTSVSVDDVVRVVVAACRLNAEEHRSRLLVSGGSHRVCQGDEALVVRALDNLIRNALQYSPAEGDVEITVSDRGPHIAVSVRDYGCGVPDDMKERIFEPFFRVDDSRQFSTGGAGLGLAMVKRIMNAHDGAIEVEDAQPGLRMTLLFPALDDAAPSAHADAPAA